MAIFTDDFESNDFSAWTSTSTDTGCSATVVSTGPYCGTYHGRFLNDADGNYARANKTYTAVGEVYTRVYVQMVSAPSSNIDLQFIDHRASSDVAQAVINKVGADLKWRIRSRDGAGWDNTTGSALSTGTWYCVELYTLIDNAAGIYRLYVNGVLDIEVTGKDSDDYGNIGETRVGIPYCDIDGEIYIDCVVVDTSYIGCISGVTVPVMMHHYNRIYHVIRG